MSAKSHRVVLVEVENYRKIDSVEAGSKWTGGSGEEPPMVVVKGVTMMFGPLESESTQALFGSLD
jgi:hypothetical protein